MNAIQLLDRPIAFHRCLVDVTGSTSGAILLSQAIYWQNRCPRENGWWWKTAEQWTEETGMKRYELDQAKIACKEFLKTKKEGLPLRTWYQLDTEALQSRLDTVCKQVCIPSTDKPEDSLQTTSTETSTKSTSDKENDDTWRRKDKPTDKPNNQNRTFELQKRVGEMYGRKPNDRWSHLEESALATVSVRENCLSELDELKAFKPKRLMYFPQSVRSLLEKWTETLDQARNPEIHSDPTGKDAPEPDYSHIKVGSPEWLHLYNTGKI